jgi:hypothetical protein
MNKHIKLYEEFLNEEATTSWSKMMKGVRAGGSGPWSIVAIQDRKVVGQSIDIKERDLIPAKYEALKREFPKAKLHIEDGGGMVVWTGPLNEGFNFRKMQTGQKIMYYDSTTKKSEYGIITAIDKKDGKVTVDGESDIEWSQIENWYDGPGQPSKAEREANLRSVGINEGVSMDAVYIHQIIGCGQNKAQDFIDDNDIDGKKLADYVKQHKDSKEKYDVRDIIAGTGVGKIKGFRERFIKSVK